MPSPFPGIDPYLEGSRWPSVQTQLSIEIARELAPLLRPKYVVRTPRRAYGKGDFQKDWGCMADRHFPGVTVEIRFPAEGELVAVIDVLLLTDKQQGYGRRAYLSRRAHLLESRAHLVEIDLLRFGERLPLPEPLLRDPYCVIVSRATSRPRCEVWPFGLPDPLPVLPVPLLEGDQNVPLDLNRALATVYDLFGYDLDVDYNRWPEVPLDPDQSHWAQRMIQMWKADRK